MIERATGWLKPGGRFLQFGVAPREATVTVSPYQIFRHDWTLIGSFALCYTFQEAIAWLASNVIDVALLVDPVLALSEFRQGFEDFAAGRTLKVQFAPST